MLIARVIGEWCDPQAPEPRGREDPFGPAAEPGRLNRGDAVVALDAVDAGVGDQVLVTTEGFSAMPRWPNSVHR